MHAPRFCLEDLLFLMLSYSRQKRLAVRHTSHTSCFRATLASSAQIWILLNKTQTGGAGPGLAGEVGRHRQLL